MAAKSLVSVGSESVTGGGFSAEHNPQTYKVKVTQHQVTVMLFPCRSTRVPGNSVSFSGALSVSKHIKLMTGLLQSSP